MDKFEIEISGTTSVRRFETGDSRLGFINEGIFRCDVIVSNFLSRLTLVMELDSIGATSIESITRL